MTANTQSQAIVRVVDDDPDVRRSWQFVTCKSSKDHSKPRNEVDTSLKSPV